MVDAHETDRTITPDKRKASGPQRTAAAKSHLFTIDEEKLEQRQEIMSGFDKAYGNDYGMSYDRKTGIVYVAGMRPGHVGTGVLSAVTMDGMRTTAEYADLQTMLAHIAKTQHITKVRGHSMGGIVAAALKDFSDDPTIRAIPVETFNSPFHPDEFGKLGGVTRYRHIADPISEFDSGAIVVEDASWFDLLNPLKEHGYDYFPIV
jgi:hypothetical protein